MREKLFIDFIDTKASREEINLTETVARARPEPCRDYDQIHMKAGDLIMHTKLLASRLAGQVVVFVGDGDCMSLMSAVPRAVPEVPLELATSCARFLQHLPMRTIAPTQRRTPRVGMVGHRALHPLLYQLMV